MTLILVQIMMINQTIHSHGINQSLGLKSLALTTFGLMVSGDNLIGMITLNDGIKTNENSIHPYHFRLQW